MGGIDYELNGTGNASPEKKKILSLELDLEGIVESSNEKIIDILTKIRGIGKWTAEYALVRGLGRLDALPANDAALKKIISNIYYEGKNVSEEEVHKLLGKWGQYKGLAAFYLLNMGRLK
jgi:DNA-3-methyladenine glycosylase II